MFTTPVFGAGTREFYLYTWGQNTNINNNIPVHRTDKLEPETMSLTFLKSKRTRNRTLLEKELAFGRGLLQGDISSLDLKDMATNIDICIMRLNNFSEKNLMQLMKLCPRKPEQQTLRKTLTN